MLLAIIMIIRRISSYNIDFSIILQRQNWLSYIAIVTLYCICVLLGPIPWKNNINFFTFDKKLRFSDVVGVYTKSNIYKYLPGNIFQYVGRNELAIQKSISHKVVAFSTILDIVGIVFSTLLLSVILGKNNLEIWMVENNFFTFGKIVILMIIVLVALAILLVLYTKAQESFQQVLIHLWNKKFSFIKMFIINFSIYAIQSLLNAGLYLWIFLVISSEAYQLENLMVYLGVIMISFVIGYITPGAPGGIGIREAVILFFLQEMIAEKTILTGTIIMRFFAIIGDVLVFLIIWLIHKLKELHQEQKDCKIYN